MFFRIFIIFLMLLSSADAFEKIIPEEDVNCPVGPVYALSLNPAKGLTVLQSLEKLETLSWPSYGNFNR